MEFILYADPFGMHDVVYYGVGDINFFFRLQMKLRTRVVESLLGED